MRLLVIPYHPLHVETAMLVWSQLEAETDLSFCCVFGPMWQCFHVLEHQIRF